MTLRPTLSVVGTAPTAAQRAAQREAEARHEATEAAVTAIKALAEASAQARDCAALTSLAPGVREDFRQLWPQIDAVLMRARATLGRAL